MKQNNISMTTSVIIILLAIGLIAGFSSGMMGIGAGTIIVPLLVYFVGYTQHQAQGTTLLTLLIPVGILGVMNYYKAGHIDVKSSLIIACTFIIGSFFGSKLSISLDQKTLKQIFGAVVIILGLKLLIGK